MVVAIVLWNTVYLERAVKAMREQGQEIDEGLLKHVAPVHWNHINLTGDYTCDKTGEWKMVDSGRCG